MSSITITTSSFGAINSTVTGQAPATITLEIGTPGPQGIQGPQGPAGPAGTSSWGSISGSISSQTDLSNALAGKYSTSNPSGFITASALTPYLTSDTAASIYQPLSGMYNYLTVNTASTTYQTVENMVSYALKASPTFTGTVTVPTPGTSSNTTVAASTAFVKAQGYATLASPTFSGDPKAPTPATSDNDTSVATTAFVKAQGYSTVASPTFTGTVTIPSGASISGYLTSSIAASTYQTLSGMSAYLTTLSAASTYLALAGGAMTGSITSAGSTYETEMSSDFFGVELSADHTKGSLLNFSGLDTYDGASHMKVNPTGLTFPDSSVQTKAAFVPGSGNLDMAGYDITNANFNSSAGQVSAQNVSLSSGGSITFGDSTVQTTAATVGEAPLDGYAYIRVYGVWVRDPSFVSTPWYIFASHITSLSGWSMTDSSSNPVEYTLTPSGNVIIGSQRVNAYHLTINGNTTSSTSLAFDGFSNLADLNIYNVAGSSAPNFSALTTTTFSLTIENCAFTNGPYLNGTSISSATISSNNSMTSAPTFDSCSYLLTANVTSNSSMTSAPSFNYCGNMYSVNVSSNASMTSAPSLSGCSGLTSINCDSNPAMTSPPDLSACSGMQYISLQSNTSMTSAPGSIASTVNHVDVYGAAIGYVQSIYDTLDGNGLYGGFVNTSGGSNQAFDPMGMGLPSSMVNLQGKGWTLIYNSI